MGTITISTTTATNVLLLITMPLTIPTDRTVRPWPPDENLVIKARYPRLLLIYIFKVENRDRASCFWGGREERWITKFI